MITVSVAATMKLTARNVNITGITFIEKQVQRALFGMDTATERITVMYTVFVLSSVYPLSHYLTTLTAAVQSGSFSTVLQMTAAQYNSTALLQATSSSITIGTLPHHIHTYLYL